MFLDDKKDRARKKAGNILAILKEMVDKGGAPQSGTRKTNVSSENVQNEKSPGKFQ